MGNFEGKRGIGNGILKKEGFQKKRKRKRFLQKIWHVLTWFGFVILISLSSEKQGRTNTESVRLKIKTKKNFQKKRIKFNMCIKTNTISRKMKSQNELELENVYSVIGKHASADA